MAESACPKCGEHRFVLEEAPFVGFGGRAVSFVQCYSCGTVVGALEREHIGLQLALQRKAIEAIAERLGVKVNL